MRKVLLLQQVNKKNPVSILNDEFCEEQVFSYLLSQGTFAYDALFDIFY